MLRILAEEMCVGVREDKNSIVTVDRAEFSARVTWQTRVAHKINVASANALAGLELRSHRHIAACWHAFRNQHGHFLHGERRDRLGRALGWDSAFYLGASEHAAFD